MRVLHVNNEKTWRGGERQTLLTVLEQRRQGVDSVIACRRGSPLEEHAVAGKIPTIALPGFAPGAWLALTRAAGKFDVIHCHTGRAHSLCALASRKPTVVSRRVDFLPRNTWFNHWKFCRANKVVCVSKCIARILQDWGVIPGKITVIYDAVPDDVIQPRETCLQKIRELTGIPKGGRIVGNIAALVGHKDHATLLRAAKIVTAQRNDVAFVIVGEGDLKEYLLSLRNELGLADRVYFTGFVPQAQRLLPGFDVFVMSSCMEGLGTIVLDAAQAGVPVAATAGGGLPEIVLHEQTGLLAPVGDAPQLAAAILRLLSEPALADRLTQAAQNRVRADFSVRLMAQSYLDIYREIAGKTG